MWLVSVNFPFTAVESYETDSSSSIAGNVITLDTDGEAALIPTEIMRYTLDQAAHVNVESSLRILASPGTPSNEVPGHEQSDPVIRLIGNVFRLAEVEKRAVEAGRDQEMHIHWASSIVFLFLFVRT